MRALYVMKNIRKIVLPITLLVLTTGCGDSKHDIPRKKENIEFHEPPGMSKCIPVWSKKFRKGGTELNCQAIGEIYSKLIVIPEKRPRHPESFNLEITVKVRDPKEGEAVVTEKRRVPGFTHTLIREEVTGEDGKIIYFRASHPMNECKTCKEIIKENAKLGKK